MQIKVGIIGMGKMGRTRMEILNNHPGFELKAICDINPNIASEFPQLYFSTKWEDILDLDLDAVVICTFNNIAPTIICCALEKKLHVFCEKPPGASVADVERIIAAENRAKDRVVKFGFNHRFHHSIMEAKAILDSGRYGELMWARGVYGKAGGLSFANSWRSNSKLAGGGILLDQGIHMLDLMRYFFGEFSEVKGFVETFYWDTEPLEDNAFALMKTPQKQIASIHSSATHWKHQFTLDLFLENGYISLNGILSSTRSYGEESIRFAKRQFEDETRAMGKPREETIYFDTDDSWRLEMEEFHNCLTMQKQKPVGSTTDAYNVMKLIEAIYIAAKENKTVAV